MHPMKEALKRKAMSVHISVDPHGMSVEKEDPNSELAPGGPEEQMENKMQPGMHEELFGAMMPHEEAVMNDKESHGKLSLHGRAKMAAHKKMHGKA